VPAKRASPESAKIVAYCLRGRRVSMAKLGSKVSVFAFKFTYDQPAIIRGDKIIVRFKRLV
jgi:hypothetical protein